MKKLIILSVGLVFLLTGGCIMCDINVSTSARVGAVDVGGRDVASQGPGENLIDAPSDTDTETEAALPIGLPGT